MNGFYVSFHLIGKEFPVFSEFSIYRQSHGLRKLACALLRSKETVMHLPAIKRLFACLRFVFILSVILFSLQIADGILLDDNGAFVPTARASEDASEETPEPASDETIDAYNWFEQAGIDIPEDSGVQVVPIGETGDTAAENEPAQKKDKDAEIESSLPESSMQSMMAGGGG
jgi:hypothetical protein